MNLRAETESRVGPKFAAPNMMRCQSVVVGAGVCGLAVARALALTGREVVVLEAESAIGTQTSSRNSEVVHAGIYYDAGSLKARSCVEGRRRLYAFCEEHAVPHRRCGKLIVATSAAQIPRLDELQLRAAASGVDGDDALVRLTAAEARELEPRVRCVGAVLSPATGVVDSHALMLALTAADFDIALGTQLLSARPSPAGSGSRLRLACAHTGGAEVEFHCDELVNCAGLAAPKVAAAIAGVSAAVPTPSYAKGNYYALSGPSPFSRLVYPIPNQAGLGVHATIDLSGQCRFGPDVEWIAPSADGTLDYSVDPARADAFYDEVRAIAHVITTATRDAHPMRASMPPGRPRRCAGTIPTSQTARSRPTTRECARRSSARANRPPTSSCRAQPTTACPGWSRCSA